MDISIRSIRFVLPVNALMATLLCSCSTPQDTPKPPPPQHSAICRIVDENGRPVPGTFTGTHGTTHRGHAANHVVIVQNVQTGCCHTFDRLLFQFEGIRLPTYTVQYVPGPITACGSGATVPMIGNARLRIAFDVAQAHTEAGQSTVSPRDRRLNCPNLRQLVTTCDFEAKVEFVAGLDAKRPYCVVELQNPTRLVIDIKH